MIVLTHRRHLVVGIVVGALMAASAVSPVWAKDEGNAKPGYVVVLKDGTSIPAKAKPISAFGKFRYMDSDGRMRMLPGSMVDLERTREANADVAAAGRGGTLSISGASPSRTEKEEVAVSDGDDREAAAKSTRSVKVYSATWCPYCKSLKKFLAEEGIAASVIEVDRLPEAEQKRMKAEMKRLTGKVSFPTVVVGDQAKAGFSPGWIRNALGR